MKSLLRGAFAALALVGSLSLRADPEYPKMGPDVFDARSGRAQAGDPRFWGELVHLVPPAPLDV